MAGGELTAGLVGRLGPLGRVERQHRGAQRIHRESAPALLAEELGQNLAQVLRVEVGRALYTARGQQPFGELGVQLLAAGEARLLEVARCLKPGIALERGAELMEDLAAEPKPGAVRV